jgi:hypothetical protein
VLAGGAIDLDEVAEPEILDPRRVEGEQLTDFVAVATWLSSRPDRDPAWLGNPADLVDPDAPPKPYECANCGKRLMLNICQRRKRFCSPTCRKMHWKVGHGYPRYTGP